MESAVFFVPLYSVLFALGNLAFIYIIFNALKFVIRIRSNYVIISAILTSIFLFFLLHYYIQTVNFLEFTRDMWIGFIPAIFISWVFIVTRLKRLKANQYESSFFKTVLFYTIFYSIFSVMIFINQLLASTDICVLAQGRIGDECYRTRALSNSKNAKNSVMTCQLVKDDKTRDYCITDIAWKELDESACDLISENLRKESCIWQVLVGETSSFDYNPRVSQKFSVNLCKTFTFENRKKECVSIITKNLLKRPLPSANKGEVEKFLIETFDMCGIIQEFSPDDYQVIKDCRLNICKGRSEFYKTPVCQSLFSTLDKP